MDKKALLNIAAKFCDRCGSPYNPEDLDVVKEFGGTLILMLRCHNCGVSHMVNIALNKGVGTRFMLNTDLMVDEMKRVPIGRAITSNEMLDLHADLAKKIKTIKNLKEQF
ncbi:hypothetical protein JW962_03565 [Candidatus Dojkabacteria bacterium]|nr:hypothetical protein [Candidatus Dojkabacteria bacterium]